MTPFEMHWNDWKNCQRCPLAQQRGRICLARGKVPCDILLIGEAPGESENILGQPFVGPAGQELDNWVKECVPETLRCLFTNLVACFPAVAKAAKVNEPAPAEIKACAPRLREIVRIAAPRLVVCVGGLSEKWFPQLVDVMEKFKVISIVHPAYVLRANYAQQGLLKKKALITLGHAARSLVQ